MGGGVGWGVDGSLLIFGTCNDSWSLPLPHPLLLLLYHFTLLQGVLTLLLINSCSKLQSLARHGAIEANLPPTVGGIPLWSSGHIYTDHLTSKCRGHCLL